MKAAASNTALLQKSVISHAVQPLTDDDLKQYIEREMTAAQLSLDHFETAAVKLILRHVHGNLRLTRNLCLASLVEACRDNQRQVSIGHVNTVLIQPHALNGPRSGSSCASASRTWLSPTLERGPHRR